MKKKFKDYHLLIVLLLISFFSVYFMPAVINRVVFLFILAAVFRTKFDYVYLVWFFIINDAPGRLFSAGYLESARIPLYPIISDVSISFQELFIILYVIKYFYHKRPFHFIFKKEFTWFLLVGIFVVGYSFLLGLDIDNFIKTFRFLFPWALVFIIPAYFYNRNILIRASLLIFPMVFLAFFSQIFTYFTGNYLDYYLRGFEATHLQVLGEEAMRSLSAVYITFIAIIQALYFFFHP